MSCHSGPEISQSGLVFSYDFNNDKSFAGPPLTNAQRNGSVEFDPWTVNGINTDVTNTSEAGPIKNMKTWKFQKTGTSNQWNGWESTYGTIWTGSAGDIWTTSYWYKTAAPAGLTGFGVGGFFLSDWSRAYNYTILSNRSTIIADNTWRWNYTITQINENYTNAITVDGPSWGYSTSAGTLYINGLQWHKNSYASPKAIFGTRSNTQVILDQTGLNTITATSLTYPYDGSSSEPFSFNGTNYISGGNLGTSLSNFTVELWFKSDSVSNYRNPIDCNFDTYAVNTGPRLEQNSSGNLIWILGDSTINYYTRTVVSSGLSSTPIHYTAITRSGTTTASYYNGSLVESGIESYSHPGAMTSVNIGRGFTNASERYFIGKIPIVRIYNRALSAVEIKQNFNALRGRFGI